MLKILYVVNVDWFFLSHRLPIALAVRDEGAKVWVAAADTGEGEVIKGYGFNFVPIPFTRKGTNFFSELTIFPKLYNLYQKIEPDLVHHVSIKPVLYGSLVGRVRRNMVVVNAITGLGFTFSKNNKALFIRKLIKFLYHLSLGNPRSCTIFQNPDDRKEFIESGLVKKSQAKLIRGSGVDCNLFKPKYETKKKQLVILASRMIWDKGIAEFIEAAEEVHKSKPDVRFVLVGKSDNGNPNAVPVKKLQEWNTQGVVEWWGYCKNMVEILQNASIIVLPTFYLEGVPKILIEAAAVEKAIIATDNSGCRQIVRDGINGILIPANDSEALSISIKFLLDNPEIIQRYGKAGRALAVSEFSEEIVVSATLALYKELLGDRWPATIHASKFDVP